MLESLHQIRLREYLAIGQVSSEVLQVLNSVPSKEGDRVEAEAITSGAVVTVPLENEVER